MGVNMKCENWLSDPPGGLKEDVTLILRPPVVPLKCYNNDIVHPGDT